MYLTDRREEAKSASNSFPSDREAEHSRLGEQAGILSSERRLPGSAGPASPKGPRSPARLHLAPESEAWSVSL